MIAADPSISVTGSGIGSRNPVSESGAIEEADFEINLVKEHLSSVPGSGSTLLDSSSDMEVDSNRQFTNLTAEDEALGTMFSNQRVGSDTRPNSAISAHIADLQHQVTLKSLALQTLQAEYASLLQKLQRERVKSRTMEKTSEAHQEVNDLTDKNEDLTEEVKRLQMQLEESERKRESERADSVREKEQWLRMLEIGGRLHSRNTEEKQRLKDEKNYLSQRVAAYEGENDPQSREQSSVPPQFQNENFSIDDLTSNIKSDIKPKLTKEQCDFLQARYQEQPKPNTNTKKLYAESLSLSLDKINVSKAKLANLMPVLKFGNRIGFKTVEQSPTRWQGRWLVLSKYLKLDSRNSASLPAR